MKLKINLKILIIIFIFGLTIGGVFIIRTKQQLVGRIVSSALSPEEAGKIATNFVNEKLLQGQANVSLVDVAEEFGLYKIKLNYRGQDFSIYISKDGKKFFGEGWDIENFELPTLPAGGGSAPVGGCALP